MKNLLTLTLLLVLSSGSSIAQTYSKRLALVVGNSNYVNSGALPNPVNDARAVAKELKNLGFEVITLENASQAQFKQAINSFGQKLRAFEVGLFYYAGHGIQHKGVNYMIPVEAELKAEEQIEYDCVSADRVLAYMEGASSKVNIIIMDACRNNPFERSWARSVDGSGLAMMNAPTGTLIAYATSPGKVASDGTGTNGLYTSALLKYMRDPSLNIEQVFKKVRTEVSEKSYGAQVPWETTSLTGNDFYFPLSTKPVQVANTTTQQNTGGYDAQNSRNSTQTQSSTPAGWYFANYPKFGYSIKFPKKPTDQTQVINSAIGDLTMDMAMLETPAGDADPNAVYMVNHTLFPADAVHSDNKEMLPTLYRNSIDGAASNVNGVLTSEKTITLDSKYEGREVTIDFQEGTYIITMRIFLVRNVMYLTQVITAADKTGNKELTQFMDSFHLINP